MVDLDKSISVARKSGDTRIGLKAAIKSVKLNEAKVVVVASNAPENEKEDLYYYANLSQIPILEYPKSSQDLGTICGRPHLTSAITIISAGDSDILKLIE
jgi:large subunit ribosomal protein L30e